MEVSADAKSDSGMIVAPKGTVLLDKHLRAFKAWGIVEVEVKDGEAEDAPVLAWDDIDLVTRNEITNTVNRLYSENDRNDPVVAEFEQITTSILVNQHSRQNMTRTIEKAS